MDLGIKGKRALIMGGSYGMGNGIARALAAEGVDIFLTARSEDLLAAEAKGISEAHGVRVEYKTCDLLNQGELEAMLDDAHEKFGGIDIQFNNCGGPPRLLPSEADEKLWQDWFNVIVMSAVKATGRALPGMQERGWGRVLTMTSSNIYNAAITNVLSSSLRMALVGWSKALCKEVAKDGITVNCLVPGRIYTDRVKAGDEVRAKHLGITPEEAREQMIKSAPMGRDGKIEEMGALAVMLCGEQAGYINGSVIRADGGRVGVNF
ncbi:MAG TPA: 3-oxoacyl-ACP reductase [Rhodospirillaceae bacterium]|nr:3-oxoacyl-ACP reductase [Rhodospirillaceae bacterium]HAT36247.1 3-oxoacyl-ACP reductase [Rhodospirillaceae bacterium]